MLNGEKELKRILVRAGAADPEEKVARMLRYMDLVLERNKQVNLTAITDPEDFIQKHYLDSLAVCSLLCFLEAENVLDLGTGGGFPGIPLAIAFPDKQFTLLDSLDKRIRIIREFCQELGISNVTAVHGRAEDMGRQESLREHFDVCLSRAVADMRVLAEYCMPFVKPDGCFIAYKSAGCQEELKSAEHAVELLGGRLETLERPETLDSEDTAADAVSSDLAAADMPTSDVSAASTHASDVAAAGTEHVLVCIRKVNKTPDKYPRRAGIPSKKPL